jgi:hypothetical protein
MAQKTFHLNEQEAVDDALMLAKIVPQRVG